MNLRNWAVIALGASTGLACSTISALPPKSPPAPRPEIHGHRGSRGTAPENTIPAFEQALAAGVEVLELDTGVTRDGVLVVYHDQKLNPVLCRKGRSRARAIPLQKLTLLQLRHYDCGALKNPRFTEQVPVPGTRVPTLDEFFQWVKASKHPTAATVRFNIETKIEAEHPELSPPPAEFARLLVEVLRRHQMLERTIIQSFDFRTLQEARKLAPNVRLSALIEFRPEGDPETSSQALVEAARSAGAEIVSPNHEWLTRLDVQTLHEAGVEVAPWTANTPEQWDHLADLGVDAIITDYPARAIQWRRGWLVRQ